MKKSIIIKTTVIVLIVFSLSILPVNASVDSSLQNSSAQTLVKLEIMKGDGNGNLALENSVKRCEYVTLVIRMLGYDRDTDISSVQMPFNDIAANHWAYENIRIGLKYKLINGMPGNRVAPDNNVTYAEALTVLIRALGYESTLVGKWPDNVISKASELGLNSSISLNGDKQLTRGEVAVLVRNSLTINFK